MYTKNKYTVDAETLIELSVGYLKDRKHDLENSGRIVDDFIYNTLKLERKVSTDEIRDAIFDRVFKDK